MTFPRPLPLAIHRSTFGDNMVKTYRVRAGTVREIEKIPGAKEFIQGEVVVVDVRSFEELLTIFDRLNKKEFVTPSVPANGIRQRQPITCRSWAGPGIVTRTNEGMAWVQGPGFHPVDGDKPIDIMALVDALVPGPRVAYCFRPSSALGVYHPGAPEVRLPGGGHPWLWSMTAQRQPDLLDALHNLAVVDSPHLTTFERAASRSDGTPGRIVEKGPFDMALKRKTQPVFEAKPDVWPPLKFELPEAIIRDGAPIDVEAVVAYARRVAPIDEVARILARRKEECGFPPHVATYHGGSFVDGENEDDAAARREANTALVRGEGDELRRIAAEADGFDAACRVFVETASIEARRLRMWLAVDEMIKGGWRDIEIETALFDVIEAWGSLDPRDSLTSAVDGARLRLAAQLRERMRGGVGR